MKKIILLVFISISTLLIAENGSDKALKERHIALLKQYNHNSFIKGVHTVVPSKLAAVSFFELPSQAAFYTKMGELEIYSIANVEVSSNGKLRVQQNIELIKTYTTHSISFTMDLDLENGLTCNMLVNKNTNDKLGNHKILIALGKVTLPGIMECVAPLAKIKCGTITAKLAQILPQFTQTLKLK